MKLKWYISQFSRQKWQLFDISFKYLLLCSWWKLVLLKNGVNISYFYTGIFFESEKYLIHAVKVKNIHLHFIVAPSFLGILKCDSHIGTTFLLLVACPILALVASMTIWLYLSRFYLAFNNFTTNKQVHWRSSGAMNVASWQCPVFPLIEDLLPSSMCPMLEFSPFHHFH